MTIATPAVEIALMLPNLRRLPMASQRVEAEQALLGGLMLDPTAWARIVTRVVADDFSSAVHRVIFDAIAQLQDKRLAIDPVTVSDYLDRLGTLADAGGLAYIARLASDTPTAANIESYAIAVRERSLLRRFKCIADKITVSATAADDRTAADLIADAQQSLSELHACARPGDGLVDSRKLVRDLLDDLDARSGGSRGLNIGLFDFDELTCGLEPGDLVVIAARPSMGKTALLVSIASTVSATTGTAVFSAEMPSQQLMRRCIALEAQINQGLLRRADKLNDDHWAGISAAAAVIAGLQLWIDDTATPTLTHIRAEALALKVRAPLGLVLVDYVQLVKGAGKNRYEELRDVAYGLKALAKELGIPIIVLAQLNRAVEARDQKRPQVSDLRDSGAIEEAADIVGLLYSEGYYDPNFSMPYVLECQIAKNRNGERGACLWRFDRALSRVQLLDTGAAAQYRRMCAKQNQRSGSDL
jgi:replicative DNA helicase